MSELRQRSFATNGKAKAQLNGRVDDGEQQSVLAQAAKGLWRRIQFNEWTFTLLLFLFSSSIVLGKIFLNIDFFSFLDLNIDQITIPTINKSHSNYEDIMDDKALIPIHRYSWLIKAIFGGLAVTGMTWFIIYEDSNEPGINPPSPFSPSKKRMRESSSSIQINYFVGILNGLLVFVYMCL